ncbi:Type 1 glutamine amidotransferase-like domain-containing protein [Actinacidiphila acidipaludis]|uniref:Peptidase E n=1 Tax=Actinacidiphila acidipaludis TaxID=2873382 RepID=A0ABS7Q855_9ACTN|nr:Type 1 glutamine amidotransferase-like domain-containing protein [Streptomyces acidipaludis]MBY8879350.1 peptidase E [Streptomyces acidipaludis]
MRLYLSSFRLGDHAERLLALLPGGTTGRPVAVVGNAMDAESPQARAAGMRREATALRGLGLDPVELDLRDHAGGGAGELAGVLACHDLVWLRGGNVFMLRQAMARSGADAAFTALLGRDALVYAGYSAGACVLAPSLRGLEHCDDVTAVRRVYGEEPVWDGLGLIDRPFVPHVDSPGHPETVLLGQVSAAYRAAGTAHHALRDGQVLVVRDREQRLF